MVDSRRAAHWFVEEFNNRVFGGGNEELSAAAECLGVLGEELTAGEWFFPGGDVAAGGEWDQKLRSRSANLLSTAKDLDEVVFQCLSRV